MDTSGSTPSRDVLPDDRSDRSENERTISTPSKASSEHLLALLNNESDLPDLEKVEQALSEWDYFGGDELLDGAMADCTRVLRLPSMVSDPAQLTNWRILEATALYLRFERDGQNEDFEGARAHLDSLIPTLSLGSSMHASALYGLGRVYEAYNDHSRSPESRQRACECYQEALKAAINRRIHPTRLLDEIEVHLGRLVANQCLFEKDDVSVPLVLLSGVTDRINDTHPLKTYAVSYLGLAYHIRWRNSARANKDDLVNAQVFMGRALLLSPHHRHRSRFLNILAGACIASGTLEGLREGLGLAKQAFALFPTIPPIHYVDRFALNTLARGYAYMSTIEGKLADLDQAIQYLRIISSSSENEEGSMAVSVLNSLCLCLCQRFEITGHLINIDSAVEASHRLLSQCSTDRTVDHARYNVGLAHILRFAAIGERDDFEAARVHLETGIKSNSTPALHAPFLLRLATLYYLQFEVTNHPACIDLAVEHGRQAVVVLKSRRPVPDAVPSYCSQHGGHLLRGFELHGTIQDLVDAVGKQMEALHLVSGTALERHVYLWYYGRALRLRFETLRNPEDSDGCRQVLEEALHHATAMHSPQQSMYLAEMAALFSGRYISYSDSKDLELSLHFYIQAAETSEGLTYHRYLAAVMGARLARYHNRNGQSARLFSAAVSFLPRMAWLGLNASKRQAKLVQTAAQLACDAAAVTIATDQLARAVELLDEGRSVMWRSVLELRTDMRALEDVAPGLAHELLLMAQSLEHDDMASHEVSNNFAEERAARRRRTAERWEERIKDVRALEGFSSFLRPLDFSSLRQAARHGPVILLNVSGYGSHALIISLIEPVHAIPLPGLDFGTVHRLANALAHALHVPRDRLGRRMLESVLVDVCRQLWDGGIGAVAVALSHLHRRPCDSPLHVWWIPTGFFSLLPIHCAGPYIEGYPGIPDLFISSYSTTLSALLRARQTGDRQGSAPRLLTIGLSETPGRPPLPFARKEMELLANHPVMGKYCSCLNGPDATVDAVTSALPAYNWIHASCHGHFDPIHPLQSAFNLMDGPLTLARIVQMRLENADFAFLSACHTARDTAFVPDESLHLAAGLQIAGFRGVVGTVWSMVDRDGPRLAERFYHRLTANDRAPDAKNAAEALHLAVNDLRGRGVPMYRWAAFVHFGI